MKKSRSAIPWQKLSLFATAGAAFASVASSGELAPAWKIAGPASLLFGLLRKDEPQRSRPERLLWNVAGISFLVFFVIECLRPDGTILGASLHLLLFLLCNKLVSRTSLRDDGHLLVLSLLLLVAGAAMSSALVYALCFLLFVLFGTSALTMLHLRKSAEFHEHTTVPRGQGARMFQGAHAAKLMGTMSGLGLIAIVGSLAVFFAFPRVGLGFFFSARRKGPQVSGFSERVDLGQHGTIKDDPQIVLRIEFPDDDGRTLPPLHLRGIAFETYQPGGHWRRDHHVRRRISARNGVLDPSRYAETPRRLLQKIYLEPLESNVLLGASWPLRFRINEEMLSSRYRSLTVGNDDDVQVDDRTGGIRYLVESDIQDYGDKELLAIANEPLPDNLKSYTRMPKHLSQRVTDLAKGVTRGIERPYAKVKALVRYLRQNNRYTTTIEGPKDAETDPLENFLFVTHAGHCEFFATALAIMLRAVDIPTREVNGFYGGLWNPMGRYLAIRQMDAHAWVEAWLPKVGWITVDPTPPGGALAPSSALGFIESIRQGFDALELFWHKNMVEYGLNHQIQLWQRFRGSEGGMRYPRRRKDGWKRPSLDKKTVAIGLGLAGCAFVVWRLGRLLYGRRRKKGLGPYSTAPLASARSALRLYEQLVARSQKLGITVSDSMTPGELEAQFYRPGLALGAGRKVASEVVALYQSTRFGGRASNPADIRRLASAIRQLGTVSTF